MPSTIRNLIVRTWIVMVVALMPVYVLAHVGGHGAGTLHEWTLRGGHKHVHASFHSVRGSNVVLEDARGRLKAYPLQSFSAADQHYIDRRLSQITTRNTPGGLTKPVVHLNQTPSIQEDLVEYGIGALAALLLLGLTTWKSVRHGLRGRNRYALWYGIASVALLSSFGYVTQTNARVRKLVLGTNPASIDSMFALFKPHVTTRWDNTTFYVENDGMPTSMPAMKGISAWQQQVPIPQNYFGANAWQIPLFPVPAATPISLHTAFHTGAVAIAANGLPIFNPENNRGEFSYEIGELDAFGGHCGRADDYHYHIAPVHLSAIVGFQSPVAWALDGYPLYAYTEPDGSTVSNLDASLGHVWNGGYHYHATKSRPYMMAQMYGKVTLQNDQVMPQPQTKGVRPFLQPLNGAVITDMHKCNDQHYVLKYTVNGSANWVNYMWNDSNKYTFTFVSPNGSRRVENYTRK